MSRPSEEEQFLDTLRLPPVTVDKILAKLKGREKMHAGSDQRRHTRQALKDCGSVLMRVTHPGGSTAQCMVLPRDISAGGVSILHGSFLHTGTRVFVGLKNVQGDRHWFGGVIVRCSYFESRVHELGVKFDASIPIHDFLRADADGGSVRRELVGKVLYVEPSVDFRELLRFQCARMGVNITTTDSGGEALEMMEEIDFDAVLLELSLPDMPGELVIKKLSKMKPKPTILALTSEDSDSGDALPSGCEALVQKPVQEGDLYQLLATYLPTADRINSGEPMCSTFWSDSQLRPVIIAFVERLAESLNEVRSKLGEEGSAEEVIADVVRIRNAAGGYGFPVMSESLGKLSRLLQTEEGKDNQGLRSAWMEVEQLARLSEQFIAGIKSAEEEDELSGGLAA
ncbi:MAG: response regulator [Phycisphaeraceae bacterium]